MSNDGVWVKVHPDDAGGDELPGLGGWATIEEVSGTFIKHPYGDWVAYEFEDDGFATLSDVGFVDLLLVAGGQSGWAMDGSYPTHTARQKGGGAGGLWHGVFFFDDIANPLPVEVGEAGVVQSRGTLGYGGHSSFGRARAYNNASTVAGRADQDTSLPPQGHKGWDSDGAVDGNGRDAGGGGAGGKGLQSEGGPPLTLNYTGTPTEYAKGGGPANSTPVVDKSGNGGNSTGQPGSSGVVIIRVPKKYAENVTENFYRWISYATVENGVVTKVTKTPDNQPYTVSTNEVECDASVQEGYLYENGEFTAPEPDYSEEIEALTARLEELRNV